MTRSTDELFYELQGGHATLSLERGRWISRRCWEELLKKMPVPCVDVIVYRGQEFLMGWRSIPPYRNVWALIGGRILHGESLGAAATRHCLKSGLRIAKVQYVGVYPVMFRSRHDITIGTAAELRSGNPRATSEMARYRWYEKDQVSEISPIGSNYRRILEGWIHASQIRTDVK
jgi:ADP-ribose pyrophosphatase YjhB (NUDIX family)